MAYETNEYGRSIAAPGLLFADQPNLVVTRKMAEAVESEGGFPLFGKVGEDVTAYGTKPSTDGYFLGIAQRITTRDEYPVGTPVSVVKQGMIWVKVEAAVSSGNSAYVTSNGGWGATGTEITNAKYETSAEADGYAVVVIK